MVVLLGAVLVLLAAVLLMLHGGGVGFVYAAMSVAALAMALPQLARWLRSRPGGALWPSPGPLIDVMAGLQPATGPRRPALEPLGVTAGLGPAAPARIERHEPDQPVGEALHVPEPRTDPPDFTAEPVFDAGPVVAAPRPPKAADAAEVAAASSEAEPSTLGEVAERLLRMETTVAALAQQVSSLADTVARGGPTADAVAVRPPASAAPPVDDGRPQAP